MNVHTLDVSAIATILSKTANVDESSTRAVVTFGRGGANKVVFNKTTKGQLDLKSVQIEYSCTYTLYFNPWGSLSAAEKHHVAAACIALGVDHFVIGYNDVVGLVNNCTEANPKVREVPAADPWDAVEPTVVRTFGTSTHTRSPENASVALGTLLGIGLGMLSSKRR